MSQNPGQKPPQISDQLTLPGTGEVRLAAGPPVIGPDGPSPKRERNGWRFWGPVGAVATVGVVVLGISTGVIQGGGDEPQRSDRHLDEAGVSFSEVESSTRQRGGTFLSSVPQGPLMELLDTSSAEPSVAVIGEQRDVSVEQCVAGNSSFTKPLSIPVFTLRPKNPDVVPPTKLKPLMVNESIRPGLGLLRDYWRELNYRSGSVRVNTVAKSLSPDERAQIRSLNYDKLCPVGYMAKGELTMQTGRVIFDNSPPEDTTVKGVSENDGGGVPWKFVGLGLAILYLASPGFRKAVNGAVKKIGS
jgi:hypothetical protein